MARWFIRFSAALFLLFFGVLLGMQQAHRGIEKMRGYADPSLPAVIDLEKNGNGEIEAAGFGQTVAAGDLQKKQEVVRELKTFNLFSELGRRLADGATALVETLLSFAGRAVD